MPGKIIIIFVVFVLLFGLVSCNPEDKQNFGVYLVDTGELVLSEKHIAVYHPSDNTFELNSSGIERWNSYMAYPDIPKLNDTLFNREFVMKIEGREICRGKFWSWASSTLVSGITITETLFKLDAEHNLLWIRSEYPGGEGGLETSTSSELSSFFEKINKLR